MKKWILTGSRFPTWRLSSKKKDCVTSGQAGPITSSNCSFFITCPICSSWWPRQYSSGWCSCLSGQVNFSHHLKTTSGSQKMIVWIRLVIPNSSSHIFISQNFACMSVCLNPVEQNTYCSWLCQPDSTAVQHRFDRSAVNSVSPARAQLSYTYVLVSAWELENLI